MKMNENCESKEQGNKCNFGQDTRDFHLGERKGSRLVRTNSQIWPPFLVSFLPKAAAGAKLRDTMPALIVARWVEARIQIPGS